MSANTIAENKRLDRFGDQDHVWLFGYGSLIFKADFSFAEKRQASIANWTRRFWQGSHDHRGTAESPGRVVTLVSKEGALCTGMAYLVSTEILEQLDFREKNGYLRFSTKITFDDRSTVEGLVYIATEANPAFLGPATEQEIARHIASSAGPSGRNLDYVLELAAALRELAADDLHVFSIEKHLIDFLGTHT